MKTRCNNPNAANFSLYGGKDIKVCKEWVNDFWQFFNDVGPMPSPDFHLARIDHKKNYEPGNVEWKTAEINSRYHSGVVMSFEIAQEIRGLYPTLTMQTLSIKYNVTIGHICSIINNRVWVDENYIPPENNRKSKVNEAQKAEIKLARKEGYSLGELAKHFKISVTTVHSIVRDGYRGEMASHSLYHVWYGMMRRCYETANTSYPNYGAKGVTVAEQWHDFYTFVNDMIPRPSKQHSLDRIDPCGNYDPSNVKWSTSSEQNTNKRKNKLETKEFNFV